MARIIGAATAMVVAATAHAETINFDTDRPGTPPAGWTCGSTGGGRPTWTVEADSGAPSGPNVLKQSGKAPFPWCVKQGTAVTNGTIEVKFKPLTGREDQTGGVVWRSVVEQYLQATGLDGVVEDGADPPDFILSIGHKEVALEVTGYHQPLKTNAGHTRREVEAAWMEVREYVVSYRERSPALDKLSVHLEFLHLSVPRTKEIASFAEAVTAKIVSNREAINKKTYRIRIEESDAPILKKYLKFIRVREVDCYMEWDWNHDFAGVGTSDDEMMLAIGKKLTDYRRPDGVDENHLIVAGWGGHLSQVAAPMHEQELASFKKLNQALEASAFDCVAILCFRNFIWRRGTGWEPLMAPKTAA